MNKFLIFKIFLIFLIFAGTVVFYCSKTNNYSIVKIGNREFRVVVASTPEEKARGLAGHKTLSDNEGMLFVYDKGMAGGFWMKGMKFPIDIIWIKDNKVYYFVENVPIPFSGQPDSELKVYNPPEPADFVLEINAGLTRKNKIKVGDKVDLNF